MKTIVVIILLFTSAYIVKGQEVLTMRNAIDMAIKNKPSLEVLRLQRKQAVLSKENIKAAWWPEISFTYNYNYNPQITTTIIPVGQFNINNPSNETRAIKMGTRWEQNAGIVLSQRIIDFSSIYQINKADLLARISIMDEKEGRNQLIIETARTYLNICTKEEIAAQSVQDTLRTWLTYTLQELRYKREELLLSDLNRAKINHNNAVNQLETILTEIFTDKVYLSFLTGISPGSILLNFIFKSSDEYSKVKSAITLDFNTDSLFLLQKYSLQNKLALMELKISKSKNIPILSLKSFWGANQYSNTFSPFEKYTWYTDNYIGLSVNFPILYGENFRARNKRIAADATIARLLLDEQENLYRHNAMSAINNINSTEKQIIRIKENIKLEKQILSVLSKRLKEYQINAFELNQEEAAYLKLINELEEKNSEQINEILDYLDNSGFVHLLID